MKIQKFNESYQGDKVIKRYHNSIIFKYDTDVKESKDRLDKSKSEILKLINEFITLNKERFSNKYGLYPRIINFNFYTDDETNKPEMSLIDGKYDHNTHWLVYSDINKLFDFLENPDLYRDTNKYNL
jgi:hypothetical protein